ncbi:MAG TPA: alpha/beta hydrolase [Nocardioidaceae bacterium]|nr:alpha/beta hydrolase [Nocardioidaceae bacterium]
MTANLRVAEWLAPGAAARWVADQWFRLPPGPRPVEVPEGGTPFEVAWEHGVVRGTWWGDGPVVYLVHGWGGRGDQFGALVEPLVASGHRVVVFDAPSHGASDPGSYGRTSTTGLEFAKALDAVFTRFGPAQAVVAHSMGTLATLLALRFGWLGTERLVFVAPMSGYASTMDGFQAMLGFGPRIRRRVDARVWARVGLAPDQFELLSLWSGLEGPVPALVLHDLEDPQTSYKESRQAADAVGAEFVGTSGLGHNRILRDPAVVARIVGFLETPGRQDETRVTLPATA